RWDIASGMAFTAVTSAMTVSNTSKIGISGARAAFACPRSCFDTSAGSANPRLATCGLSSAAPGKVTRTFSPVTATGTHRDSTSERAMISRRTCSYWPAAWKHEPLVEHEDRSFDAHESVNLDHECSGGRDGDAHRDTIQFDLVSGSLVLDDKALA